MFANESPRTWVGLSLYGLAAIALLIQRYSGNLPWHAAIVLVADILVLAGIATMMSSNGALKWSMRNIYQGFRTGEIKPHTPLQKLGALLGLLLVIASTVADNSL